MQFSKQPSSSIGNPRTITRPIGHHKSTCSSPTACHNGLTRATDAQFLVIVRISKYYFSRIQAKRISDTISYAAREGYTCVNMCLWKSGKLFTRSGNHSPFFRRLLTCCFAGRHFDASLSFAVKAREKI